MDSNDQPQERVLIEDYPGPAAGLPPSTPNNVQITAETKHEPGAVTQTAITSLAIDRTLGLATLGMQLSMGAVGGLCPVTYLYLFQQNPSLRFHPHDIIVSWFGALIVGMALLSFIMCAISLFRDHTFQRPAAVVSRGKIGLVLSSLALMVIVVGYLFG